MKTMLFVESYPQSLYGQQQTLLGLLTRCAGAGIEPVVAAPRDGVFLDVVRKAGVRAEVMGQPAELGRYGGAVYRDGLASKARTAWRALGYAVRLRSWLDTQRPDCVFCNDLRGLLTFGLAARFAGIPVLIWDKLDQPHGVLDALQLPIANRNLVVVQPVVAKYPAWQRRLFRGRIRRVFDGVALEEFGAAARGASRDAMGEDEVVLAIAGTITPRKGHDLLAPAFRRARSAFPKLRLRVIGDALSAEDTAFRDEVMAATRDDPGIEWLGRREDVAAQFARIDMLVSPSRREGISRVCMEAMAAGKPVIGAAGTGLEDVVVEGETGFLVDPADEAALADRILRLARDPGLRARMGAAGRRRAEAEFDQDRQLGKVLDELLDLAR